MSDARHDLNQIDLRGDDLVLTCECGWQSPPSPDGAVIGAAWDEHRQDARS